MLRAAKHYWYAALLDRHSNAHKHEVTTVDDKCGKNGGDNMQVVCGLYQIKQQCLIMESHYYCYMESHKISLAQRPYRPPQKIDVHVQCLCSTRLLCCYWLTKPCIELTEPCIGLTEPCTELTEPCIELAKPCIELTEPLYWVDWTLYWVDWTLYWVDQTLYWVDCY